MKNHISGYYTALIILLVSLRAQSQLNLQQAFDDCKQKGSIKVYDYKNNKWTYSNRQNV